ncbi:MAG TPA: SLBB domain-containing protein [Fimbriimonas sp.]
MKFKVSVLLMMAMLMARLAGAQAGSDYVIGVDDILEISVSSHEGMDKELTVLADGTITYSWAGTLKAAGKTAAALASEIKALLEKTRNNVQVTVTVKEVRSRLVRIVGPVKNPGGYNLKANWRVLDLIATAGGLNARPGKVTGRVVHTSGKVDAFEMAEASLKPDTDANPVLTPDDLVLLEERDPALDKVYVMGQVSKPGSYEIAEDGTNLAALLSQAGNVTESAALTRATVMRGSTLLPLNLEPMVARGIVTDEIRAFKLQAGDVLFIPETETKIAVMGQVNRPGQYPLPEVKKLSALDALSLAGGQSQTGDIGKAGIIRVVNGKATVLPVNLDQMMRTKDLAQNVNLEPGDVLYVPTKNDRRFEWRDILSPLSFIFGLR